MHVAIVIDNLGSGGAQRQAVEVAVRLRAEGVRVGFGIYRPVEFFRPRLEAAGVAVDVLPKRAGLDPGFPFRLRGWLRDRAPDVVHAFLPAPTLWTALAGLGRGSGGPAWIAGERSSPRENVGPGLAALLRWAYGRFDAVTVNSHPAAEVLVSGFGLRPERVHYLPNGIDLAEWDRRAAGPAPETLAPERFHVAVVGRISEEKNHRLFLEALSRLEPERRARVYAWFLGAEDGPRELIDGIRNEIEGRGLAGSVRMLPPTAALPALMARLDALVLPSRYEGFPNVVLEAMASRLPVLASAVGEVPFMLEDGRTGWVVPAGDAVALASGLARLLDMSEPARTAMGAAAREVVEARYRIESVARMHLDLYRRLADERGGDARVGALG